MSCANNLGGDRVVANDPAKLIGVEVYIESELGYTSPKLRYKICCGVSILGIPHPLGPATTGSYRILVIDIPRCGLTAFCQIVGAP